MRACNEVFLFGNENSPKALFYLSQTFALVRRRLSEDLALCDGTLAVVMSLVIQEQVRGEKDQAAVHFRGLKRMIELRGGLDQLSGNTELLLKACK